MVNDVYNYWVTQSSIQEQVYEKCITKEESEQNLVLLEPCPQYYYYI